MASVNPVPKLYRSVIEDVIEAVRSLFAEEGVEEQVLKDLKQLWETKILQSKATEDFFRNNVHPPLFTFQLPHGLHQAMQSPTASIIIPTGRTLPSFTTELGTSSPSTNLTFPGYPVHVPAGVTLQSASGHLYKVSVPIMVTQTAGRANILQHPFQQVFQQFGQPSLIPTSVPGLGPCSLQATTEKSQRVATMLQQPTILCSGPGSRRRLENGPSDAAVPGNEHKMLSDALLSQQESSQFVCLEGGVFPLQVSETRPSVEPGLCVAASMPPNLPGGPGSKNPHGVPHQRGDAQLHVLPNRMYGYDSVKQHSHTEEPHSLPGSVKESVSQVDFNIQAADEDTNEIIQIDGTDDTSSNEELESTRDVEESEFPGIIDVGDLKVLEEEADSISNEDSTANSSENEDFQIAIVEEDSLNSGDDVSEQDVPDLFDTDNVIVCQYDKIHRSKNKWKLCLKDGVVCFGGRDYVFAKAIGDAEW